MIRWAGMIFVCVFWLSGCADGPGAVGSASSPLLQRQGMNIANGSGVRETSASSFPAVGAAACPSRPNGGVFYSANYDQLVSGITQNGSVWISNIPNPTSAADFTQLMPSYFAGLLPAGSVMVGDTNVDVSSQQGELVGQSHRLLFSVLVSQVQAPNYADRVAVFRSDDCGASWQVSLVQNPSDWVAHSAHDQDHLYVDPGHTNYVYVVSNPHEISPSTGQTTIRPMIALSTDGGKTFAPFHRVASTYNGTTPFERGAFPVVAVRPGSTDLFLVQQFRYTIIGGMMNESCNGIPGSLYAPTSWALSYSTDMGNTWSDPSTITWGESKCYVATQTGGGSAGVYYVNRRPSFTFGSNGHCVLAISEFNTSNKSEQVRVFESADGLSWNNSVNIPIGQQGSTSYRDQFFPTLVRNRFNRWDPHLVLAWYDTRQSMDGQTYAVYAVTSSTDGVSWDIGSTESDQQAAVLHGRLSDGLFQYSSTYTTKHGEYWGGTTIVSNQSTRYFFAHSEVDETANLTFGNVLDGVW